MFGTKVEPLDKPPSRRGTRRWKCVGPCMISFGIPLLIPGVTLTCVALSSNTGLDMYTGLHVTGYIFLAVGIFLLCAGCVIYHTFQIKVGPLPVVLVSQVDLRLSHSQRLYLRDKPSFIIRSNSAKPSTCFRVENEIAHNKNNFRGTGKVSNAPGQYNKHGEHVHFQESGSDAAPNTNVSTSTQSNPERSGSTVTSEESTTSSESETEDSTSSSYGSSDTSSSDSSLNSNLKPQGTTLANTLMDIRGSSSTPENVVANIPLPLTKTSATTADVVTNIPLPLTKTSAAHIYFSQPTQMERIEEMDSRFKWENTQLSEKHLQKRASEDVKSEEFKPALLKSIAWYATEGNTSEGLEFKQQLKSHQIWPNKRESSSVDAESYDDDTVDGDNVEDADDDDLVENNTSKDSDSIMTSSDSAVFSPKIKEIKDFDPVI